MSTEKVSLTMSTTSTAGKNSTKSITDINDNASDSELLGFATAFNNLTTNTLGTVAKVTKREIDNEPAANPILSVQSEDANIYTVTGSGTEYNIAVALSAFQQIDDAIYDDGKMVKVTLQDGVYGSIYNGRYQASCDANLDNVPGDSGWIGALVWLGSERDGVGQDSVVFACPVAWNKDNIDASTINNVKVTFPATKVGTTTYAAWSLTFTFV